MTRCLIYCRTSGDDSERDSLEYQEINGREYAKKQGYEVFKVLKEDDKGVGGAHFFAPEIQQAIEYAKQGCYDVLVTKDASRFARDSSKAEYIEFQLYTFYGVTIEFLNKKYEDTSEGKLIKHIDYYLAEKEKSAVVDRMHNGKLDRIKYNNSFMVNGNSPLGYEAIKIATGIYEARIVEAEAEIVRLIFRLYVEDGLSVHAITKKLNADMIPTYSKLRNIKRFENTTTKWYPSNVSDILKKEIYKGKYVYGRRGKEITYDENSKKIVKHFLNDESHFLTVDVPAIVSPEIWEAAQVKLRQNTKGRKAKNKYLMARRITCFCSYNMNGSCHKNQSGKTYLYYRCTGEKGHTKRKCKNNARADLIDYVAWNWLENILTNKDELKDKFDKYVEDREKEMSDLFEQLSPIKAYLEELQKRYDKLIRSYISSDDYGQEKLTPFKLELEEEMKSYEQRQKEINDKLHEVSYDIHLFKMLLYEPDEILYRGKHLVFEKLKTEGDKELTFEEKLAYIEQFNLRGVLLEDGRLKLYCDLGEAVCELYDNKGVPICQTGIPLSETL